MRRTIVLAALLATAVWGCAGEPDVALRGGGDPGETAWRHLATTEASLDGGAAAEAVESQDDLASAWRVHGLPGTVPEVDFDRSFVLLAVQADDACVDELIRLEVVDGSLELEWLAPPGGCAQPLIMRLHAIEVDRRHVPARFDVALDEPFADMADEVTVEVAAVDGQAPPAPEPPAAMTDEDLDAVFAGHELRRCTPADDPFAAQAGPGDRGDVGEERPRDEDRALSMVDDVRRWMAGEDLTEDVDYVPFIAREDGAAAGVLLSADAPRGIGGRLEEELGDGQVVVRRSDWSFRDVAAAQDAVNQLMGDAGGPGSIVGSSGVPGPVVVSMVDPTRDALDRLAGAVDADLVCVDANLSGVGG
jgi:hypothetical protein